MRPFYLSLLCVLTLLLSCEKKGSSYPGGGQDEPAPEPEIPTVSAPKGNVVVGYATYWDTTIPNPKYLSHICYAFAHIKNDFETLDIKTPSRLTAITALKKQKPELKILLSVGGWGAGNFSEMAASKTHRKNFAQNCLKAVTQYGLDGIDLDWEYPTSNAAGISSSPSDTYNFTLLVKELRSVLGADKLLTMASADNGKYVDFKAVTPYFNFINLMTYDMGNPPKHNAGLYPSSRTYISCDESVSIHNNKGVPYEKIVMGIPFYGHGDGKAYPVDGVDYRDIKTGSFKEMWDETSQVPYLADEKGNMVLSYDNARSVDLKAQYILKKGLKGAMYWNIEADDDDWTLSKVIATRLLNVVE